MDELPVILKTYDLIAWYVPIINRMPRDQKFALGDLLQNTLYDLLEGLIQARYAYLFRYRGLNTGRSQRSSIKGGPNP